ncbi:Acetyltransferase, GNAT family [Chitinispirillum alkaliphilum]|nr:Acetyltransferase, GNAT family [Chitinispirillum alkaliphilum]
MKFTIRNYHSNDKYEISDLVKRCTLEINSKEYPQHVVDFVINHFTPDQVEEYALMNSCLVAVFDEKIIGTISLGDGNRIYSTFVSPSLQRQMVGTALLQRIETIAFDKGISRLKLQSSLYAEKFYARNGYVRMGELMDEAFGRTITMQKIIAAGS